MSTKVDSTLGEGSMKDGRERLTGGQMQPQSRPTMDSQVAAKRAGNLVSQTKHSKIKNDVALGQNGNSHTSNVF